jgi:predicted phosphodiesterase
MKTGSNMVIHLCRPEYVKERAMNTHSRYFPLFALVIVALFALAIGTRNFPRVNASAPVSQLPQQQQTPSHSSGATSDAAASHFFAVGDTGSGNTNQLAVSRAMTHQAKLYMGEAPDGSHITMDGVLHLGDIIYPRGEGNKVDSLVHQMYAPLTQLNIPFYFALGNHDALTNEGKDVAAALKLPEPTYYAARLGPHVQAFAINTNTFARDKAQQDWLRNALSRSSTPWQVVFGHHPLYSTGAHGHDADLVALRQVLEPMLKQQGVEVYLAGHDHNYERFVQVFSTSETPTHALPYLHIVSGGGGAHLRETRKHPVKPELFPKTAFYDSTHYHFLDVQATPCDFHLQARDTNGEAFDSVSVHHPTCKPAS